jgi:broad specificity phosphatase PhoE
MALPRRGFWFLRHGQTEWNARGVSQGAVDLPLNETGRVQARAAAPLLEGRGLVGIVASPLSRARETAEIVNRALELPLDFDPDLREVMFGGQEGKPLAPWFQQWLDGDFTPPGAESFSELSARAAAALQRILPRPGPLLIVSHGAIFRAMRGLMGVTVKPGTPNGIPIRCEPHGEGWSVQAAEVPLPA